MQTHDTHLLSNSSSNNYYEGQIDNQKLILYKDLNVNKAKNFYYYNEGGEDYEGNKEKFIKNENHKYKNSKNYLTNEFKNNTTIKRNDNNKNINNNNTNNIKYDNNKNNINKNDDDKKENNKNNDKNIAYNNNDKQKDNELNNNEYPKKISIINYVSKDEKSKNLFYFKGNKTGFNMINHNNDRHIKYIKGRKYNINDNHYEKDDEENYKEYKITTPKFDIEKLRNKKANEIKIISKKKIELPISSKCYFSKCTIICEQKLKLPISNICHFNKSTIYIVEKIMLPINNICYFNKTNIVKEIKFRNNIITDYYFCTKENKVNEKKDKNYIIENCIGFDFIKKLNLKKKMFNSNNRIKDKNNINNISNKKFNSSKSKKENESTTPIFKYTPKVKKKNKESEEKFAEYKKKMNNRLKSYKLIKHEDIMKKIQKDDKKNQILKTNNKINSIKVNNNNTIKASKSKNNSLKMNKYFSLKNKKKNNNNNLIRENKNVTIKDDRSNSRKIKNYNNYLIKSNLYKSDSFPRNKIKTYKISQTENKNNSSRSGEKSNYLNSSSSFSRTYNKMNNRTNYNNDNYFKYSFYNLFDVNSRRNNDSAYEDRYPKNKKKILQRFIENGQNKNNKKNKENNKERERNIEKYKDEEKKNNNNIMPKINDIYMNKQTPKARTIISTQSSRFLIKKINSSSFKNRNNNMSLFNITKKQNNLINTNDNYSDWLKAQLKNNTNSNYELPGIIKNNNIENNNECNHHNHFKYDKHFGNEMNCPKCQSMDIKINYLKERKNEIMPNIFSHNNNNNSFNKTIDDYQRDNIILPFKYFGKLYLKNYNNYRNNTKNTLTKLQRNNSVIQIKKINISKYSEQLLKNYQKSLLAIKEYFNIK